jgi:hypothetical protein
MFHFGSHTTGTKLISKSVKIRVQQVFKTLEEGNRFSAGDVYLFPIFFYEISKISIISRALIKVYF